MICTMLTRLRIHNFLLIENLDLELGPGFTVITGETGAGKSILLGALGLLLGERAENRLLPREGKCTLEAFFSGLRPEISEWLHQHDFDETPELIIRRELLIGSKGRCFINDTPAQVAQLRELGNLLIDIHAQLENRELGNATYRCQLLDNFASLQGEYQKYYEAFLTFQADSHHLNEVSDKIREESATRDYRQFLIEEFEKIDLQPSDSDLEDRLKQAENAVRITEALQSGISTITDGADSILQKVVFLQRRFKSIAECGASFQSLSERLTAIEIELKDLHYEMSGLSESELPDEEVQRLRHRLDLINGLKYKHKAESIEQLIQIEQFFRAEMTSLESLEYRLLELRKKFEVSKAALSKCAEILSDQRLKAAPVLSSKVEEILKGLGMSHARFGVNAEKRDLPGPEGGEWIHFVFSANKGMQLLPIEKIASGGEYSRIVLAIKSLIAQKGRANTIIFDEVDAGVSGEIADRMAVIMKQIATDAQVIAITHLPQVAARGNHHLKVFKQHLDNRSVTHIQQLTHDQRIIELATMLSGNKLTDAACENARTLLHN